MRRNIPMVKAIILAVEHGAIDTILVEKSIGDN